jgi:hypothetical protein
MNTIRTMLLGAALTVFATSAAFAQTADAGAQGSAGLGTNVQTPMLGVGAQAGAGANAGGSGSAAGSLVDGALSRAGKSVGEVGDATGDTVRSATSKAGSAATAAKHGIKSAASSTKQHAKEVASSAKTKAGGMMSTAAEVGRGAQARTGAALGSTTASLQSGTSIGLKSSGSASVEGLAK